MWVLVNSARLDQLLATVRRIEENMSTQTDVDALTAQVQDLQARLDAAAKAIQAELDTIKTQHPTVDVTALQAAVTALSGSVAAVEAEGTQIPPTPTV